MNDRYAPVPVFTWLGFVLAISFMEAWLKFRAPGVTMQIGVGIGRIVFAALNRVEWSLVAITAFLVSWDRFFFTRPGNYGILVALMMLVVQTFMLLPVMDARAESLISGAPYNGRDMHMFYIGAEVIKVGALLFFGLSIVSRYRT